MRLLILFLFLRRRQPQSSLLNLILLFLYNFSSLSLSRDLVSFFFRRYLNVSDNPIYCLTLLPINLEAFYIFSFLLLTIFFIFIHLIFSLSRSCKKNFYCYYSLREIVFSVDFIYHYFFFLIKIQYLFFVCNLIFSSSSFFFFLTMIFSSWMSIKKHLFLFFFDVNLNSRHYSLSWSSFFDFINRRLFLSFSFFFESSLSFSGFQFFINLIFFSLFCSHKNKI